MTALIFDVGGVLIDWNPRHLYSKVFGGDEAAMEWFLAAVCTHRWNARQDEGRPFSEAVAELSAQFPEYSEQIAAYHLRWEEMVPAAIGGTVHLVQELKRAGVPLYALTNFSAEKFPLVRRRFDVFDLFDGIVVSGEIGIIKPDPAIYRFLLDAYALEASACIFIDDAPANVDAARSIGMRGILFQSPAQLRRELNTEEIPSNYVLRPGAVPVATCQN
jgi:2-haloacid dehalogenase